MESLQFKILKRIEAMNRLDSQRIVRGMFVKGMSSIPLTIIPLTGRFMERVASRRGRGLVNHTNREGLVLERGVLDDVPARQVCVPDEIGLHSLPIARMSTEKIGRYEIKAEDRKSTRLNSSHIQKSRMPSSA